MSQTDSIKVTMRVEVDPETAFEVFTREIDAWWRRGPRFRFGESGDGHLRFEPGVGGRLLEEQEDGQLYEIGRVRVWEPGERLVFSFRARAFTDGEETEVEVVFEAEDAATRVTLVHRGWDSLPKDHPARHGLEGPAFTSMIGLWWADLLRSLRAKA
ncbi:MAG: SRPBCC domain-containing protein [Planctomycetota bacterium]